MRLQLGSAIVSLLLCFLGVEGSNADILWTANVNISYVMDNRTLLEEGEIGVYGHDSPVDRAYGLVILPKNPRNSNYYACTPNVNFSIPLNWNGPWIALIQRGGGCTFSDKIIAASVAGARAVVIYNNNGEDNEVIEMSHPGKFQDSIYIQSACTGSIKKISIAPLGNLKLNNLKTRDALIPVSVLIQLVKMSRYQKNILPLLYH